MKRWALRLALTAVLLLAFALRVHRLDGQELRGDEAFGYFFSARTAAGIVAATIELREPHPVASYLVQRAWLRRAGEGEFALRFVGVWFSTLAVALAARLALRLWSGRRSDGSTGAERSAALRAWVAALLMAVSPYLVWHAQDARMYSMSLALTLASTWLALEWLERAFSDDEPGRPWPWAAAYLLVTLLALHTHYFAIFVVAAQNLFVLGWALTPPRSPRRAASWLTLQAVAAVLYLPWLWLVRATLVAYRGNGDSPGLAAALQRSVTLFAGGESGPPPRLLFAAAAVALLALGTLQLWRGDVRERRSLFLLWLTLAVPLAATWWSARQRPIFDERYLVAAAPSFFLLIAAGLAAPAAAPGGARALRPAAAALTALLVIGNAAGLARHYADPTFSKTRGWRELAAAVERLSAGLPAADVRIAQNFPDPTLWYYYRGPVEHVVLPPAAHDEAAAAQTLAALGEAGVRRVILPVQPAPNWDDAEIAARTLAAVYDAVYETQVGVWPLRVYAGDPRPAGEQALAPPPRFAGRILLTGVSGLPEALPPPGGLLTFDLFWSAEGIGSEKVTVQLIGPDGGLAAQQDRPLAEARRVDGLARAGRYGIRLPEALAPGVYRLIVAVYDPAQAGAPRLTTAAGEDHVTLATYSID